ncbi:hypothetical protein [Delftia acidovorans]|uniref:hypothetical protein n=1 Tax=Delftia acidovorans TaxID=80866 RepID=UPI003342A3E8
MLMEKHPSDIKHAHVQLNARRINCDENIQNEYGMLVMIIGVLTAVVGGVLAFLWLPRGGAVVGLIGAILGFFGLIIHFSTNAKSIFGGD